MQSPTRTIASFKKETWKVAAKQARCREKSRRISTHDLGLVRYHDQARDLLAKNAASSVSNIIHLKQRTNFGVRGLGTAVPARTDFKQTHGDGVMG
jgi:hypothetical protein